MEIPLWEYPLSLPNTAPRLGSFMLTLERYRERSRGWPIASFPDKPEVARNRRLFTVLSSGSQNFSFEMVQAAPAEGKNPKRLERWNRSEPLYPKLNSA